MSFTPPLDDDDDGGGGGGCFLFPLLFHCSIMGELDLELALSKEDGGEEEECAPPPLTPPAVPED